MSAPLPSPPAALPLSELIAELRAAGLPIGIREHLTVGKLLDRWDVRAPDELRAALAGVLARSAAEAQLVRETFDRLYPASVPEECSQPTADPAGGLVLPSPRWLRRVLLAILALLLVVAGSRYLWSLRPLPDVPPPDPPGENGSGPSGDQPERPDPPQIPELGMVILRVNWWKVTACSMLGAACGLALAWRRRSGTAAFARRRRSWTEELDELPEPATYRLQLSLPEPHFSANVLDDLAACSAATATSRPAAGSSM
jgi:hypothetical protein